MWFDLRTIKRDVIALFIAYRDPRTPWYARLFALLVVIYALSPIDLIPDFIPVIGYLDDLLILPLGVFITFKLIPPALLSEYREKAAQYGPLSTKKIAGIILFIVFWSAAAALVVFLVKFIF